jgi:hypothetical protein
LSLTGFREFNNSRLIWFDRFSALTHNRTTSISPLFPMSTTPSLPLLAHAYPNTLTQHGYVRVMLDYCSSGLWDKEGCNVDVSNATDDLLLIERIAQWQATFENRSVDHVLTPKEHTQQQLDGLAIAHALRVAHPTWTIVLYDGDGFFKHARRTSDGRNVFVDPSFSF